MSFNLVKKIDEFVVLSGRRLDGYYSQPYSKTYSDNGKAYYEKSKDELIKDLNYYDLKINEAIKSKDKERQDYYTSQKNNLIKKQEKAKDRAKIQSNIVTNHRKILRNTNTYDSYLLKLKEAIDSRKSDQKKKLLKNIIDNNPYEILKIVPESREIVENYEHSLFLYKQNQLENKLLANSKAEFINYININKEAINESLSIMVEPEVSDYRRFYFECKYSANLSEDIRIKIIDWGKSLIKDCKIPGIAEKIKLIIEILENN